MNLTRKKTVLILSVNPKDTRRLRSDEEIRTIEEALRDPESPDRFEIKTSLATPVADLQAILLRHKPHIVHFCGHGEVGGLMFEDATGKKQQVPVDALAELFKLCGKSIECVVLNACYTKPQAEAIHQHIPCVIGMNQNIGDKAAILFAAGFYTGLGNGKSYHEAFDFGRNRIGLDNIPEASKPEILEKQSQKEMFITINVPKGKTPLSLITAGKRDDAYFKRVSQLDLGQFYAQKDGGGFIENLRNQWKNTYDFVLIDSRTGISDVGGVCTIQLPDMLVLLLTPTAQSLKGTVDVAQKAMTARQYVPGDRLNLLTLAVPTRFDGQVRASMPEEWLQKFVNKLLALYENWLPHSIDRLDFLRTIRIPYTPHYSFGEQLPVLEKEIATDPGGVKEAYENLAVLIASKLQAAEQLVINRDDYVKSVSMQTKIIKTAHPVPVDLHNRIIDFLYSIPGIHEANYRQALIVSADLDTQLQQQIDFTGSSSQFFQLLVFTLTNYGKFKDGRDPLSAVLEAAKHRVGQAQKEYCDTLIQELTNREDYVKSVSMQAEITKTSYILPIELTQKIVTFLQSLPNIHDIRDRRAFIYSAGLDIELQEQMSFTEPPPQFSQLLVSMLLKYGELADERNALETVLEASKNYIGQDKREYCEMLIQEYRAFRKEAIEEHVVKQIMPSTDPEALREAYLNCLLAQTSQVFLAGIDRKATNQDIEACLNLGAIYTALLTLSTDSEKRSVLMQLNQHPRLVLLGDPGSGKSTFVNFVAMCLAGELLGNPYANLALLTAPLPKDTEENEDEPQEWQHGTLLPILVSLRDFAARGLPPFGQRTNANHLWTFISATLEELLLGDYVPYLQQKARVSGVLLLLDGLDDVPEAEQRRTQIKQAIEEFALLFPKCRILLTSRTYAYQQQEWRLSGFTEAVLAPFTKAQIRQFIDHWYRHSAEVRGMNLDNARGQAELLKQAILKSDRLYSLAERPLLLTLMASLHYWRGGSLPEKREELYNDTVDLLLDWWERPKVVRGADGQVIITQPSLTELLNVSKDRVRYVLDSLAFQAHASQPDLVGTADIAEQTLKTELMNISQNPDLRPRRLLDYLSNRAGLLVPRGVGVYTFSLWTFQEYLSACYLADQDDYPYNVAELGRQEPDRWREVVLLAGARVSRNSAPQIWFLAEALCYKNISRNANDSFASEDASEPLTIHEDVWGALLAGQVLVENANLQQISPRNQSKVDRIRSWLAAIMTEQVPSNAPFPAVERAFAGNLLAVLGGPRPGVGLWEDGLPDTFWYEVPAGKFLMGSDPKKDKDTYEREQPQHKVFVPAYQISRYPITNVQYQAFVEDGGYTKKWRKCWTMVGLQWKGQENICDPYRFGGTSDLPNHPVVGVSWYETVAYCRWLTIQLRKTGKLSEDEIIRLPTEAEWEKAARGSDERIYPWGNELTPEYANYTDTGLGATSTVSCFPRGASPYGCEDMTGNIWEWCLDVWHENYEGAPSDGNAWIEGGNTDLRVLRGGSWESEPRACRCAVRFKNSSVSRLYNVGFRIVRVTASKS